MKRSDDAPPLRSCLRSGQSRNKSRVWFSQDSWTDGESHPSPADSSVLGGRPGSRWLEDSALPRPGLVLPGSATSSMLSPPPQPRDSDLMARTRRLLALTSDLYAATHCSQEVCPEKLRPRESASEDGLVGCHRASGSRFWVLDILPEGGDAWSDPGNNTGPSQVSLLRSGELGSARTSRPLPVSELSSVLKDLLDLVDQRWTGPRSLHCDPCFLGRAYDLLAALLQPGGSRAGLQSGELVLVQRKLVQTQQQLEWMKRRLLVTLKENYHLKLTHLKKDFTDPGTDPGSGTDQPFTDPGTDPGSRIRD